MPRTDRLENRLYMQAYRARRRAAAGTPPRIRKPPRPKLRPFVGVDGEGCGRNRHGQQHYMLLRGGDAELFTGKPLRTYECLDFLCDLPSDAILVGFAFGYDATMILRDLPPERIARLFSEKPQGEGVSRYTYFEDFGIEYLPRNYLRVCRVKRSSVRLSDGRVVRAVQKVKGSTRTIWEAFGFFQQSFIKALHSFEIGRDHWAMLKRNKDARGEFKSITREIRRYCALECELLADLMSRFREVCHDSGIRPVSWSGAGKIAAALHREHHTITAAEIARHVPDGAIAAGKRAYYGGRFEITHTGRLPRIWEYDLRSAYPAAARDLPCLEHGTWHKVGPAWFRTTRARKALFVADVQFAHPIGTPLCGLPVRQKSRLLWPREGCGTYWSVELRSAERLGAEITYRGGWRYQTNCQCHAFDWIDPLYQRRKVLGKLAGVPIKLGLNSLYGKLAQRIGNPRYGNMIWAGLITAMTRARLNDAIALDPHAIVMLATDAVLSLRPLALPPGDELGQWEASEHPWMFVVQPGLYWSEHKPRTRGVPESQFAPHRGRFERAWLRFCRYARIYGTPEHAKDRRKRIPRVAVPLTLFTGLRLAHARGKPRTSGVWAETRKEFAFDWIMKRQAAPTVWHGAALQTWPHDGGPDLVSEPHDGAPERANEYDLSRAELDEQPDHIDLSPP